MRTEDVAVADLKPHPQNYRKHPEDQLVHLEASLRNHGVYRNVVVARDLTILAGHGVVEAAKRLGLAQLPVVRLDLDPDSAEARKVLVADNELGRFAESDDRVLADLLKEIGEGTLDKLLGTGWDEMKLTNLAFVTRAEVKDIDAAAEWAGAGMPAYSPGSPEVLLSISFPSAESRDKFVAESGVAVSAKRDRIWSGTWPPMPREAKQPVEFAEDLGG